MTSLLVDPTCDFTALRARLDPLRWRVVSQATQPILPGEPEHATFERGASERTHYTFNPVCRLRVLEFNATPDSATRAAIPAVSRDDIAAWLASSDERTLLRGLLAARLDPDRRFADRVATLTSHPRESIAAAAARANEAVLGAHQSPANDDPASRATALAMIEVIKAQVQPVLAALMNDPVGSVAQSLRPRPEDYDRVFVPDVAASARAAYDRVWADGPPPMRPVAGGRIETAVAPAGMLTYDNELSRQFPGGYRAIAHLLDPRRTWVRWKYLRPGEAGGMSFDGLVWCDDHWAWFPKPFRVLPQRDSGGNPLAN